MRLINADEFAIEEPKLWDWDSIDGISSTAVLKQCIWDVQCAPVVEAIPVWYIIRWYEKRYKLGSTVADDWERGLLKEKIAEMHDDFKNEKYLDNKESGRYAQMVKEVIELYNDWEKEKEVRPKVSLVSGSVKFSDNVTITQINNDISHGPVTAISSVKPDPNLKLVGNKEEKENG